MNLRPPAHHSAGRGLGRCDQWCCQTGRTTSRGLPEWTRRFLVASLPPQFSELRRLFRRSPPSPTSWRRASSKDASRMPRPSAKVTRSRSTMREGSPSRCFEWMAIRQASVPLPCKRRLRLRIGGSPRQTWSRRFERLPALHRHRTSSVFQAAYLSSRRTGRRSSERLAYRVRRPPMTLHARRQESGPPGCCSKDPAKADPTAPSRTPLPARGSVDGGRRARSRPRTR